MKFLKENHDLYIHSNREQEITGTTWVDRKTALSADVIFYCTPISSFENMIEQDVEHVKSGTLIIDVL